jgi:hypothetical protein
MSSSTSRVRQVFLERPAGDERDAVKSRSLHHIVFHSLAKVGPQIANTPIANMKSSFASTLFVVGVMALAAGSALGDEVQGKVVARKGQMAIDGVDALEGKVETEGKDAQRGKTKVDGEEYHEFVSSGQILQTGAESAAVFLPVPGQVVVLGKDTTFQAKRLELVTEDGKVVERLSVGGLKGGYVQCSQWKPEDGTTNMRLDVPWGYVHADGSSWGTWATEDSARVGVFSGVVYVVINGREIKLLPGQIMFLDNLEGFAPVGTDKEVQSVLACDPAEPLPGEIRIVDLTVGRVILIDPNGDRHNNLITPADLSLVRSARDLFQAGVPGFVASVSRGARIGFTNLLDRINLTLIKEIVPTIPQIMEDQLFPEWKQKELRVPTDIASESTPG